jgi:hypothetical protein
MNLGTDMNMVSTAPAKAGDRQTRAPSAFIGDHAHAWFL